MAYPNGRLPASALTTLPTSWSNAGRVEQLDARAAASLSRMLLRAVAHTGTNFQLYDGYRSLAEQVAMLRRNYRPVNRRRYKNSDRSYQGKTWARKAGRPATASPGHSNHGTGLAIDLHPAGIQTWVQANGRDYGWTWTEGRKLGEPWHFVYVPALDRFTAQGTPDVAAIQRALGVTPDGKFGTGTSAAVKLWQAANGLKADGIPGPDTVAALLGGAKAPAPDPAPSTPAPAPAEDGFAYTYAREDWDPAGVGEKVHPFDHTVRGVYIHHPGTSDALGGESHAQTFARLRGYRDDHLAKGWSDLAYSAAALQDGTTIELRGLGMEPGANGGSDSNDEAPAILAMLGNDEEPTAELLEAINGLLAQVRDGYATVEYVRGHRQSPDASTTCPGDRLQACIDDGRISYDGTAPAAAAPNPVPPATVAGLPTGKDLLVKLQDIPDFPLLRTPDHLCYYGDEDKREAVSGKVPNSLVPGEVSGSGKSSGAQGLKRWQAKAGIEADGRFGKGTEKKVREVQKRAGLKVDGKLGPTTWYALWLIG